METAQRTAEGAAAGAVGTQARIRLTRAGIELADSVITRLAAL